MGFFLETLMGGLMAGMLYSLIALGFVLIFKASGVFNFAQGAMVLFAALAMARFAEWAPGWLGTDSKLVANTVAFVLAMACMVGVAWLIERLCLSKLVNQEPIALLMQLPNLLVVHPSVPANNLQELIAYAKQNPGKLRYGHPGGGTTPHLSAVLLNQSAGIQMEGIPYKTSAQMTTDLLAGHYEVLFHNSSVLLPHVQSGAARAMGVTAAERVATVPGVPTERPPTTASKKGSGLPSASRKSDGVASAGAVSRPSKVVRSPLLASYQTRNAPPPRPEDCGSTRPSMACTATRASAALPPSRRIFNPACAAIGLAAATMNDFAVTSRAVDVAVEASGAVASEACWDQAGVASAMGDQVLFVMFFYAGVAFFVATPLALRMRRKIGRQQKAQAT